jgi:hypothetical protein
MVDYVEVGRSAMYRRYNNGPRTLPWGMPTLTGEVLCTQFQPVMQIGFQDKEITKRERHSYLV